MSQKVRTAEKINSNMKIVLIEQLKHIGVIQIILICVGDY